MNSYKKLYKKLMKLKSNLLHGFIKDKKNNNFLQQRNTGQKDIKYIKS